jgi:hypothetical protein
MVADWRKSLHAQVSPEEALEKGPVSRRMSAEEVPGELDKTVVGCAECHMLNSEKHKDTFEHNGFTVHVVVTPEDCSTCHPIEVKQYAKNLMSHAAVNLGNNPIYRHLADSANAVQMLENGSLR